MNGGGGLRPSAAHDLHALPAGGPAAVAAFAAVTLQDTPAGVAGESVVDVHQTVLVTVGKLASVFR